VADVEKILQLVEQGALSAAEADEILAALDAGEHKAPAAGQPRHLRIEITDHGRRVVNLRVPINIASLAAGLVPGLPEAEAERIRASIRSGMRGPIVDVGTDDGERVLIISE
jgi:hypothetical protein